MKKSCRKETLFVLVESLALTVLVLGFLSPLSCKITELGLQFVKSDYEPPSLTDFSVSDSSSATLRFSREVRLSGLEVLPSNSVSSVLYGSSSDGNFSVSVEFEKVLVVGEKYSLYGIADDGFGNSLTFSLPFSGYNENVAGLEILEVHSKYAGQSNGNGVYKNEYVLFHAYKSGNLSGLRILGAHDGEEKSCSFPPIEVREGEKIAVHLRKKGEGCIDELEGDLSLSTACYSKSGVRDLWAENEGSRLGDDMDVIVLEDVFRKKIVDAVLYAPSSSEDWKGEFMRNLARRAHDEGAWNGFLVEDSAKSDGMTASRSLLRNGRGGEASSWTVSLCSLR